MHCPTHVFDTIVANAAVSAENLGNAVAAKDHKDQELARRLLFERFPRIPLVSAEEILQHGFLKHSRHVGRSTKLDADEKIELAAVAHIRHKHTEYDAILEQMRTTSKGQINKEEARAKVLDKVRDVAISWRASETSGSTHQYPLRFTEPTSITDPSDSGFEDTVSESNANESEEELLERALHGMRLDNEPQASEGIERSMQQLSVSGFESLTKGAKKALRKAEISIDLAKLKKEPQHPLTNQRMNEVIWLHESQGGDVASLGFVAEARANFLAAKRASRHTIERQVERQVKLERRKSMRDSRDRDLLSQYQSDPNVEFSPQQLRRIKLAQRRGLASGRERVRNHEDVVKFCPLPRRGPVRKARPQFPLRRVRGEVATEDESEPLPRLGILASGIEFGARRLAAAIDTGPALQKESVHEAQFLGGREVAVRAGNESLENDEGWMDIS